MIKYEPVDVGASFDLCSSTLENFVWDHHSVVADFLIPNDENHVLRAVFHGSCIVRLLDEMALSTEDDDGDAEGLVPDTLCYRVEGAAFSRAQSETWKSVCGPAVHYRFITGWTCMDVLTGATPRFGVVPKGVQ
jgi:hypothetical protein